MKSVIHAVNTTEEGHNWLEEWKEATSLEVPTQCPCCDQVTQYSRFVGAHVILHDELCLDDKSRKKFITPTCKSCNDRYKLRNAALKSFLVEDDYLWELIPERP